MRCVQWIRAAQSAATSCWSAGTPSATCPLAAIVAEHQSRRQADSNAIMTMVRPKH